MYLTFYQRSFMAAGSLTLGGNMSVALGPLGRNGEAATALNTKGKLAAMSVYSVTLIISPYLTPFQVQLFENAGSFWWRFSGRLCDC
jgi:Las17-binding protein actin regulator